MHVTAPSMSASVRGVTTTGMGMLVLSVVHQVRDAGDATFVEWAYGLAGHVRSGRTRSVTWSDMVLACSQTWPPKLSIS